MGWVDCEGRRIRALVGGCGGGWEEGVGRPMAADRNRRQGAGTNKPALLVWPHIGRNLAWPALAAVPVGCVRRRRGLGPVPGLGLAEAVLLEILDLHNARARRAAQDGCAGDSPRALAL